MVFPFNILKKLKMTIKKIKFFLNKRLFYKIDKNKRSSQLVPVSFFFLSNISSSKKRSQMQLELLKFSEEKELKIIIEHWIRISNINLGWIPEFDKLVVNYATAIFIFDTFRISSSLSKTIFGHTSCVYSINYSTFNVLFDEHSRPVSCTKFSQYHYYNYHQNIVCSSSYDKTIRFWDIKNNKQLKILNEHTDDIFSIEFSPFNNGKYLCSGSRDETIRLWDIETYKILNIFNGHKNTVRCIDFSSLQNNNNNNKIGGNGYAICSGSYDKTIRIWDIETTKQLNIFNGHTSWVTCIKYGSNELGILSGSLDSSIRLWDIRSGKQIQVFNGHTHTISCVEYSPFIINNNNNHQNIYGNSNVICSGSYDNTIRFWDIRSNKEELYKIKGEKKDNGISCITFLRFNNDIHLYYGSYKGFIQIWR
ncbi:WD-40 repeat protein [Reticulomyxa filosa]|uniref:WD-40 repeat protein n=1 Tax=Reticulomyxa filosa TaxID=46433 RepID=X6MXQ3_RETFI|nr:WD-40 repeat protein [Reticulomyxa filosa]|eukprot:ETO18272.1 WD-40 repeat protein [Reticulomyxa filosa]